MNKLLEALNEQQNLTLTENGAVSYKSTKNSILDMFALGGSYRNRNDNEIINLFSKAFAADGLLATKCLFYLRDITEGQGERRFFRVCYNYLANTFPEAVILTMEHVPTFGRWDDLFCLFGTPVERYLLKFLEATLVGDYFAALEDRPVSLLAKWLPSENASSKDTKALANVIRKHLKLSHKKYRQLLSMLRKQIRLVETAMSQNKWEEIDYTKIPSIAGFKYRNAFARHDWERYTEVMSNKSTKVNATVLNPMNIAKSAFIAKASYEEKLSLQKYWDNLKDYYNGREENGIAVVDVSGSMWGDPLYAAVGMGAYIAERGGGAFKNHFITFSTNPSLVEIKGNNIYDKFQNMGNAGWGMSTNISAVFDLLLKTAVKKNIPQEEMPKRIYVFTDMEFDYGSCQDLKEGHTEKSLFDEIGMKWKSEGYELPQLIFWNLNARHDLIPALDGKFAYVSGRSLNIMETLFSGKNGWDLCLEKLLSKRYDVINAH